MVDSDVAARLSGPLALGVELRKEAYTMALYVAICLDAALMAFDHDTESHADVVALVWGTTVGLALAHWFAFRVSAMLVARGSVRRHDAEAALAQLAGAAAVALLVSVPALLLPDAADLEVAQFLLAALIAVVGYTVARGSGAARPRSILYGLALLVVASIVAGIKFTLTH